MTTRWHFLLWPLLAVVVTLVGAPDFVALDRVTAGLFELGRSEFQVPRSGFVFTVPVQGSAFRVQGSGSRNLERGTRNPEPEPRTRTPNPEPGTPGSRHRSVFVPLYVSFAALQAMDVHSTLTAIGSGAGREANPFMGPIVGNPAAFIAVKAAMTTGVIYAVQRLRAHHAIAAIVFMSAIDSAYAFIAAHNYEVANGR